VVVGALEETLPGAGFGFEVPKSARGGAGVSMGAVPDAGCTTGAAGPVLDMGGGAGIVGRAVSRPPQQSQKPQP